MREISLEKSRKLRGIWLSISQLKYLVENEKNLTVNIEPENVDQIRNYFIEEAKKDTQRTEISKKDGNNNWANAHYLSLLCDLVVFDNIFIDAAAFEISGIPEQIMENMFGGLYDIFYFVRPSLDVYKSAISIADQISLFHADVNYLEAKFGEKKHNNEFWDGTLKKFFDHINSPRSNIEIDLPSRFVDSQGTIERLLFYLQLQRLSGAPVRLNSSRLNLLRWLEDILPASANEQAQQEAPNQDIEKKVLKRALPDDPLRAPPVFDMIMRELCRDGKSESIIDVVARIRKWNETIEYRDWLWKYHRARAERKPLVTRRIIDKMNNHVDAIVASGDGRDRRTMFINFSLSPGYISAPVKLRFWRMVKDDYVGFIGEWFEPTPKP